MKNNCIRRKRAFTLTELLIVVIVIGVLSAVTLPKFNRVIENRKVTEAEEMMSAVRMEQERRCTLDQNYTTNFSNLTDVIASANTKNYTYSLQSQGISARSASGDYTLKILSYEDGSYCCTGTGCKKLNKNYPDCATLSFPTSNCAGTEGGTGEPGTDPGETPECADGQVQGSQACNGCGVQTTQKCVNGKWTNVLGTCSKTAEECEDSGKDDKKCELTATDCLKSGQIIDGEECKCVACPEGTTTKDGYTCGNDSTCDDSKKDNCTSTDGTWSDEKCSCTCPANKNKILASDGKCVSKFKPKKINVGVLVNCHYCPTYYYKNCSDVSDPNESCHNWTPSHPGESCQHGGSTRNEATCKALLRVNSYEFYVGGYLRTGDKGGDGCTGQALWWTGGTRIGGQLYGYPGRSMPNCHGDPQDSCDSNCNANSSSCTYKCLVSKQDNGCNMGCYHCSNGWHDNNAAGTGVVLTCVL